MKKKNKSASLEIYNVHAGIGGKEILKGVSLTVRPGEVHAIMGPNGSGKSTLASVIFGHPGYEVKRPTFAKASAGKQKSKARLLASQRSGPDGQVESSISIGGKNILDMPTEERARAGLFLAFQSPIAIPGVSVMNILRSAYQVLHGKDEKGKKGKTVQNPVLARRFVSTDLNISQFISVVKDHARFLHLDESFLSRGIHDGFSGGEKKKVEMLTALVLRPKFAVFDEIDTGLDVDALQMVARGMDRLAKSGTGIIVITHYQRILRYVKPQFVHIFIDGRIVKSGGATLAKTIEKNGYKEYEVLGSAKVGILRSTEDSQR